MENNKKTFQDLSPSRSFKRSVKIFSRAKKYRQKHFDEQKLLSSTRKRNKKRYRAPLFAILSTKITRQVIADVDCFVLGNGQNCVIYFHGGSYANAPNVFHWRFLLRLAKQGIRVILPLYGRVPQYTAEQTLPQMTRLYQQIVKIVPHQKIFFLGDSAGGGLALALCEHFVDEDIKQPQKCVLLSPWLDVDMDNDYDDYDQKDVVLLKEELQFFGRLYRGRLSKGHKWCSPLLGVTDKIAPTFLFVGEGEMLFEDVKRLKINAKRMGAKLEIYSYPQMQHDFMLHPIAEATPVQNQIFDLLKTND